MAQPCRPVLHAVTGRPWSGWSARRSLVTALAAAGGLRLLTVGAPARPDEAGYLMVAQQWRRGGEFLYGPLWLDRPPLLLGAFALADRAGGLTALRLLAVLLVLVLVLAAADAGRTVGGARGGVAAAAVTAALQASPALSAPAVDGELLALPLVMVGIAVGLRALVGDQPPARILRRHLMVCVAGVAAGAAILVKQNFVDAVVFLGVVLVVQLARRELPVLHAAGLLGSLLVGLAVPLVGTLAWASWAGAGAAGLWEPLVSFRSASLEIILGQSLAAPATRAARLGWLALATGLVPLLLVALARRPHGRAVPVMAGVGAVSLVDAASIALGGSYWTHYLLQLVPGAALAAGVLAGRSREGRRSWAPRVALLTVVLSAALSSIVALPGALAHGCGSGSAGAATTAAWLREHAQPGDSVVPVYGGANTLLASGLRPWYPYLWSLPVRVLDPELHRMGSALTGPAAATWVVQSLPTSSWGLDADEIVRERLRLGYRRVATVCGRQLHLRSDLTRPRVPSAADGAS